jgi:hypothetical protein
MSTNPEVQSPMMARARGAAGHISRGGLCLSDQKIILDMTLRDIAEEFLLPEDIFVQAIELLMIAKRCGQEQQIEAMKKWSNPK